MNLKHVSLFSIISVFVFLFQDYSLYAALSIGFFVFMSLHFIKELGKSIPVRELTSLLLIIQMLISPIIVYHYFDNEASFVMYIPEEQYLKYTFWACLSFTVGLFSIRIKFQPEQWKKYMLIDMNNIRIGYYFLVIGYITLFINALGAGAFSFLFIVLSQLRFIGAFYLWFSEDRFRKIILPLVYLEYTVSIIKGAIFYDLLVWLFFLSIVEELRSNRSFGKKFVLFLMGVFFVFFIQVVKVEYRKIIWGENVQKVSKNSRVGVFVEVAQDNMSDELILSNDYMDNFISRLNTGWIVSKVMEHTPSREPFTGGSLFIEDLEAIVLPRFLNPGKKSVGGIENREKFKKFTGRNLSEDTTMRIGAISDAYVNFGIFGGCVLLFIYGYLVCRILNFIHSLSNNYPSIILWVPLIFTYVVRMSDFLVMLNSIWKSALILFLIFIIFKKSLRKIEDSNLVYE